MAHFVILYCGRGWQPVYGSSINKIILFERCKPKNRVQSPLSPVEETISEMWMSLLGSQPSTDAKPEIQAHCRCSKSLCNNRQCVFSISSSICSLCMNKSVRTPTKESKTMKRRFHFPTFPTRRKLCYCFCLWNWFSSCCVCHTVNQSNKCCNPFG